MSRPVRNFAKMTAENLNVWHQLFEKTSVLLLSVYFAVVWRLKVYGRDKLPKGKKPYIVIANHISNLDPPCIATAIRWRPISYMAKAELYETRFGAWYYFWVGAFAVNRDKIDITTIKSALTVMQPLPASLAPAAVVVVVAVTAAVSLASVGPHVSSPSAARA